MAKKKRKEWDGIVYSDDDYNHDKQEETLLPEDQLLKVRLESKNRNGKSVTIVSEFIGLNEDLKELGKSLKSSCGVGGTVKDMEIIIQGDFREKICQILEKKGFSFKRIN